MQAPQAPALLDNVRPDFPSPAPTRRWWARRYVGICSGTSPHLAATRWHVAYWAKQTFFCYRSQMRDWLWKYQRPTVIWWQIWLKRDLKARGHFPQPLGNQFVRELTEMLMKDAAYWPGEIDWNQFRNRMRASTQMVEDVIRNQAELAKRDAMPPPHFLVMKHLGYFDGYIQRN